MAWHDKAWREEEMKGGKNEKWKKGGVTVDASQEKLSVRRGRQAGTLLEGMSRSEQPASSEQ